ncbi:hypothetical protein D3C81_1271730 [compost metagenome]
MMTAIRGGQVGMVCMELIGMTRQIIRSGQDTVEDNAIRPIGYLTPPYTQVTVTQRTVFTIKQGCPDTPAGGNDVRDAMPTQHRTRVCTRRMAERSIQVMSL